MKTCQWGIVGPGSIAKRFAVAAKHVAAELCAVASRTAGKGEAFAAEYGIPYVFTSYEEMAASPLVDCVYIATPHPFHESCAEIFLRAKKHVLCEKPLCVNARQARALRDLAEENGVFLMEAMWTRFLPAVQQACIIAKSGEIGEVLGLDADFCYASSPEKKQRLFSADLAGGALLDVGTYTLHLAAMLFGTRPKSIRADATLGGGVDYHTHTTLTYENGAIASLSSAITIRKPEDAYIYGTRGYIRLPRFYGAQEVIVHRYADDSEEHISLPYLGNGFEEEITEVCRCVTTGKSQSDILPLSESIAVLEQMDEIRRRIGVRYPCEDEKV